MEPRRLVFVPADICRHGFVPGYERDGLYGIADVMPHVGVLAFIWCGSDIVTLHDFTRYQVFQRSLCCSRCGVAGQFFAKERCARRVKYSDPPRARWESIGGPWHLNLYGLHANGTEVLMTQDHIIPKARGGSDELENLETMCLPCNNRKGHKVPKEIEDALSLPEVGSPDARRARQRLQARTEFGFDRRPRTYAEPEQPRRTRDALGAHPRPVLVQGLEVALIHPLTEHEPLP